MHGGDAFAALNNFTKSLVEMMYFRRRNWMKTKNKKKVFAGNWRHISPKSCEDQKKRSSPLFAIIFGRKFVGCFSPGWLFFLWSSSAQLSLGGTLTLDGGTRPPASTLQFNYWLLRLLNHEKSSPKILFIIDLYPDNWRLCYFVLIVLLTVFFVHIKIVLIQIALMSLWGTKCIRSTIL